MKSGNGRLTNRNQIDEIGLGNACLDATLHSMFCGFDPIVVLVLHLYSVPNLHDYSSSHTMGIISQVTRGEVAKRTGEYAL